MDTAAHEGDFMPVSEARDQVLTVVERVAMVHYHFATAILQELGEEKGRTLIAKAIEGYGREVGERHRAKVIAAGLAPSCENYKAVPDLARLAWSPESMPRMEINGQERPVCPLARYWIEKGAPEIGRLYCGVDQAKYRAFDPECECRHLQNVLDGDDGCQTVGKKRSEWERIDGGAR